MLSPIQLSAPPSRLRSASWPALAHAPWSSRGKRRQVHSWIREPAPDPSCLVKDLRDFFGRIFALKIPRFTGWMASNFMRRCYITGWMKIHYIGINVHVHPLTSDFGVHQGVSVWTHDNMLKYIGTSLRWRQSVYIARTYAGTLINFYGTRRV